MEGPGRFSFSSSSRRPFHDRGSSTPHYRRGSSSYDRRESSGYDRRESSGYDRRESSGYDRRESSGYNRRESSGYNQREFSGYGRRESSVHDRGSFRDEDHYHSGYTSPRNDGHRHTRGKASRNESRRHRKINYRNSGYEAFHQPSQSYRVTKPTRYRPEPGLSRVLLERLESYRRSNIESAFETGDTFSQVRSQDRQHDRASYKVGTVYTTAHHTPTPGRFVSAMDPFRTATMCGSVHSKFRPFVVVNVLPGNHFWALPIFTHHGTGLQKVGLPDMYASIRDADDEDAAPAESFWPVVRALRAHDFPESRAFMHDTSSIALSMLTSHRYDQHATIEGQVIEGDIKRLLKAFHEVNFSASDPFALEKSSFINGSKSFAPEESDPTADLDMVPDDDDELEEGEIREEMVFD